MIRYHRVESNRPPMLFALSLVTLLVACGDGEDLNNPGSNLELGAAAPDLGAPPTQIRPSVSVAQLFGDNTLTASAAQAIAAGETVAPTNETAATPSQLTTNAPPVINTPTVTPVAASEAPAPVTGGAEPEQGAANPVEPGTATALASTPVAVTEPETQPASVATTPVPTQAQPGDADTQTRFSGSTSPTFFGEVLDDQSVQLTWEVDPTARGYNVYRDAEYIETVFEATYLDEFDAFDRNYYYEIQAFDFDENFSTIASGLTVRMTGTGRIDPNDPLPAVGLLDDYELVFSDEFNGDTLDTSKWSTSYIWGDDLIINNELQHYVDIANDPDFGYNPFTFDGEALTINTIRTPDELLESANGQQFLSGVITSFDSFQFTYGYVETRAQVPFGKGYWPAFWLLNAFYDRDKPEIDIMEFIGDNQDTVYHTFHYHDAEGNLRSTSSEPTFPIDFPAQFHTFGAEWGPGTVTFYVDGIAQHTINDPKISQEQMYIIANTALGGWWPGDPDASTEFPGEYKIDYIRAYQRVGVQLDPPQFASPDSIVPVRGDQDFATPGHLPPFELFPDAFPELK